MEGSFLVQYNNKKKIIKCSKSDIRTECQFYFDIASQNLHFELFDDEEDTWTPFLNLEKLPLKARLKLFVEGIVLNNFL